MEENFQIRDAFNEKSIEALANRLKFASNDFDEKGFCTAIFSNLVDLSYSERIESITLNLYEFLPKNYPDALKILLNAQLPTYASRVELGKWDRFMMEPFARFVSNYGQDYFELSMTALYEITKRWTSEFGIRNFLIAQPEAGFALLKEWASDPDEHVRRLVSEGTRPYLPWGKKLFFVEEKPQLTIALLDLIFDDASEYVRRSVANHLNDLAKKHPDLVVETLEGWRKKTKRSDFDRLGRHALRTLVKNGHTSALKFMGFDKEIDLALEKFQLSESVEMGKCLDFSFEIISKEMVAKNLVIDYIIYFLKANGSASSKVFKLKNMEIKPNEPIFIEKSHKIKPITTRVYYAGMQALEIQVNGQAFGRKEFRLNI